MALLRIPLPRFLLFGAALALCRDAGAQPGPTRENQIKADFLLNFAQFVDWPPRAFASPKSPLVVGLLGEDPFGSFLDELARGETVNGRPIVIRRCADPAEARGCQLLFISRSEGSRMRAILSALRGRNILTVGDTALFNRQGGIIRLATENNRIRIKINLTAAQAAGLTLSSQLLARADITAGAPAMQ